MSDFVIKIIVPLNSFGEKQWDDYVGKSIKEVLSLDGKIEMDIMDQIYTPDIYLIDKYKEEHHVPLLIEMEFNALVFEITITNSEAEIIFEAMRDFKVKVFHFLIFVSIAKPGSVSTRKGKIYINDILVDYSLPLVSLHYESLEDIQELKWPKYHDLPITQVLKWAKTNNFNFDNHSKYKVERALYAYTYLFKDNANDIVLDLLWSLVGIEAIYCSSKEGIANQINEKAQVFLGPLTDFKKRLKKMYDFRSRLIHGSLDIPPNHYEYIDEEQEKFQDEMYNSTILGIAVLTATLQEMVFRDITELNFKYQIE